MFCLTTTGGVRHSADSPGSSVTFSPLRDSRPGQFSWEIQWGARWFMFTI